MGTCAITHNCIYFDSKAIIVDDDDKALNRSQKDEIDPSSIE